MLEIKTKAKGAELTSIKLNGKEKLHQGNNVLDENGKPFWGRHAPVLFPIVGQIKNNQTIINGKTYEMTQHGFARDCDFEQLEKTETKHTYLLKSNEETLKKYPFEFELYITYTVEENTLITEYTVINKDNKEMIFGLGGHPAFVCDYSLEEYELQFNQNEDKIEFMQLENGLLSNTPIHSLIGNNSIKLTKNIFDNDAIIMKNINSNKVILKNTKTHEDILEFDFTGFPYLAIWSKKGAPFVCIEPWFNTTDKVDSDGIFEHKENILKLQPNEKFECKYKVKFY